MSKAKKLKKNFTAFVNQLTPDECREQLVHAYLQMETCMQVLRGADVEPISMMDNGESSDLELFYMCKKVRKELDYLNENEGKQDDKKISISVDIDCSEAIKHLKELEKEFEKLQVAENKFPRSDVYVIKVDLHKYFPPIHFDARDLAIHPMFIDYFS